jgi:hypothetical protein
LPLPENSHVNVTEGFELIGYTYRGDLFQLYYVSYSVGGKPFYRYTVERYSGKIREFEDRRGLAPKSVRKQP